MLMDEGIERSVDDKEAEADNTQSASSVSRTYDCPVYPCLKTFSSVEELRTHLIDSHKKSVRKHGLQELLDYARHARGWYMVCWRKIYFRK